MNKIQAYQAFWTSFGLPAYDETHVPDGAQLPYITIEVSEDFFDNDLALTASIWYRSESWKDITEKAMAISEAIGRGGRIVPYDGGGIWIRRGSPWAQRMSDTEDDMIRRIVLNVIVEYEE